MTDANQLLNADAIYAAMVYLRDYAESPEGQAAFRDLLDEKAAKVTAFRAMVQGTSAIVYPRPVFEVPDVTREEIYPGEPRSVDAGIELARSILWGPPIFASIMLENADLEDPMMAALSRFVADRAN